MSFALCGKRISRSGALPARWKTSQRAKFASIAFIIVAILLPWAVRAEAPQAGARTSPQPPATAPSHTLASSLIPAGRPPAPAPQSAAAAPAASLAPVDAVPRGPFEDQLIPHREGHAADGGGAGGNPATAPAAASGSFQTAKLCLALGTVLVTIYILQKFGRRFFNGGAGTASNRGIRVVSRSPISPRQHLLLIQVGGKLVLVGNNGTQMNPICEIDDADEVAALLGQARGDANRSREARSETRSEAFGGAFGSIFRRAGSRYEEQPGTSDTSNGRDEAFDDPDASAADAELNPAVDSALEAAMGSAIGSPRMASNNERREPGGNSDVSATRLELNGLMEKVRQLSKHFQRT